jgi:hypothetical protein
MKLRRIRLNNLRRFTSPVQIDGITDGLNVLSAPNEQGKSTLFDAVQALFFEAHRSRKQSIQSLQPHAGGAPEISLEVEAPDGTFLIEKRWLSRPQARVSQGARLIAQADDAEAWIARLMGGGVGPAGLLWVRQGQSTLSHRDDGAIEARRDLLSSVVGEVDAITGGRRMDTALRRCREELSRYLTPTGRARSDGPLAAAQKEAELLTDRRIAVAEKVESLGQALARRRVVRRLLAELRDPVSVQARHQRLNEAAAAHSRAERHAETLKAAGETVTMAGLKVEAATRALESLRAARQEVAQSKRLLHERAAARAEAEAILSESEAAMAAMARVSETKTAGAKAAARTLTAALRHEAAQGNQHRRDDLVQRISQAEAVRRALEQASAGAATGPTPAQMARLDELAQAVATARHLRDAGAVRITMTHAPGGAGGVMLDGSPLEDGEPVPVAVPSVLALRGLGELSIHPGRLADHGEAVVKAEADLRTALDRLDQPDLEDARRAAASREEAKRAAKEAHVQLGILAPDGIEALIAQLAALPEPAPGLDLPCSLDAQTALDVAEAERQRADTEREAARSRRDACRDSAARAAAAEVGARERLARATAAMSHDDPEAREAELATSLHGLSADHAAALARQAALAREAPDLAAARAARDRAQSVVDAARAEIDTLTQDLGRLDTLINVHSSEAVEEELSDTEAQLSAAAAHLDRVTFEVAVLRRLEAALDAARAGARDRYFAPVMAELAPLLRLLWPKAHLSFDHTTLLPRTLIRAGQEEGLDVLSGGTQEQIALLVRLAFARMHARAGHAAPLILDDALVFTDDDRIEAMFDALHRQAADLQIIVLTCRQRAFRDLGGNRLTFSPVPDDA